MEKVNPIILTMEDGTEYTLEFSRKSIEFAEKRGFKFDELSDYLMTRVPELFYYSFRMHHANMTKKQTDDILFEKLGGMSEAMLTRLGELYAQGYESLINSEESKNSKVTITM